MFTNINKFQLYFILTKLYNLKLKINQALHIYIDIIISTYKIYKYKSIVYMYIIIQPYL